MGGALPVSPVEMAGSSQQSQAVRIPVRRGVVCVVQQTYNVTAVSFTPRELCESIKRHLPGFQTNFAPDFRQDIASTWPRTIDDSAARRDWHWQHRFGLDVRLFHAPFSALRIFWDTVKTWYGASSGKWAHGVMVPLRMWTWHRASLRFAHDFTWSAPQNALGICH